jgi:ribonuclease P protein component
MVVILIGLRMVAHKFSFPRARRLTRAAEFERVRKEGKVWKGGLITLAVAPARSSELITRAGIIASRKVGPAVVRNRARRRVRDIQRRHQHEIKSGIWLVTIISSRAGRAGYRELEDEWLHLAGRASILTP